MGKDSTQDYERFMMTDRVDFDSSKYREKEEALRAHTSLEYIVVVAVPEIFDERLFIVDGNHRAAAHAVLGLPIKAILLNDPDDHHAIEQLVGQGIVADFPHGKYLRGKESLQSLTKRAVMACIQRVGFKSLEECCRCRREYLESRFIPINDPDPHFTRTGSARGAPPGHVDCDGDRLASWARIVRAEFATHGGDAFPCSYERFADMCGEPKARGQTITKCLEEARVIEALGVRTVETGEHYPGGNPVTQRISFWRLAP
ncbi:MAG: ParB/Srx family N-terminal domain-containing protein [Candidatus Hydrogenedentota bacterium]